MHLTNARIHFLLLRLILDLNDDRGTHHGARNARNGTRLEHKIATDTAFAYDYNYYYNYNYCCYYYYYY